MTAPPNAPEVDVLAVLRESAHLAAYERKRINPFGHLEWQESADKALSKVAALLASEAALDDRNYLLSRANIAYSEQVAKLTGRVLNSEAREAELVAERDALAAEVGALRETAGLFADDAQRFSWLEQMFSKYGCAWLLPCGPGMCHIQFRHSSFDNGVKNFPTVFGGLREAVDAARAEAGHG